MATPAAKLVSREVFVHILVDQNRKISRIDPDPFWVSKGGNQEVVFQCTSTDPSNPHPDFTVEFNKNGSPFNESVFRHDCPCSGLVRRNVKADPNYIYRYTVTVGEATLDPGGGVQP